MSNLSENEIREWMEKNYPRYKDNIELGKILYSKEVLKKDYVESTRDDRVTIAELKNRNAGERVKVSGIVAKVSEFTYLGCPICKKKNCELHDEGEVEIKMTSFLLGDNTGTVWCSGSSLGYVPKEGEEVTVVGKTRKYKGSMELSVFSIEPDKTGAKDDIVNFIDKSGKVKYSVYEAMCQKKGINPEELINEGRLVKDGSVVMKK